MFWQSRLVPARIDNDEIVPLPFFDDTLFFTTFVLHSMFVFDDLLDSHKLQSSLERLARRDGWQKLGARLRRNTSRAFEYHIPTEHSDDRPAITCTHVKYDTTIREHPVGSRLPKPSTEPAIVGSAESFSTLYLGPDSPTRLDDYLYADRSILGLHIVSFVDASIVVLNWIHAAFDAQANRAILHAWILMMQGKEDEIPTPCDYHEDPLSQLGKNVSSAHKLSDRRMSMFGLMGWALNNAFDMIFRSQETRIMCVPGSFVDDLRAAALRDLAAVSPSGEKPFLSEGDVLTAWLARLAVSHLPRDSNQTLALQNSYSYRKFLEGFILPRNRPYISNCVGLFSVLLTAGDILTKPLSYSAQQIRRAIVEQTTLEQTETYCSMIRESGPKKLPPVFGDSSMHLMSFSNWSNSNFFGVDFSAASTNKDGASSEPLRPIYIQNVQTPYKFTEMFPIMGKDNHGNYWLSASRLVQNWTVVEKALERGDFLFEKAV